MFVELYDLCGVHVVGTSCALVLQVLCDVRGARALFDHIRAPGVRRVLVLSWRSGDLQRTVPHTTLCYACPNSEVVYSGQRVAERTR